MEEEKLFKIQKNGFVYIAGLRYIDALKSVKTFEVSDKLDGKFIPNSYEIIEEK